ncbi:cytochrome c oxidase subunit II [Oceanospirillum multiglobuliferum]|uniref:Cytochrome c oxidase subunit 2 n=1 Tax=Oceanospirillum multiglobuliferum TaxID=64969 RepID=A0A1V4T8X9_9GAMM|nr:cytochrome c oxidase subunit II [Oceanospirillum multiglobuliferum]OPX56380.1 cytochrome c oxidase subunit II [Oceanospirillum multiglobuliferum]
MRSRASQRMALLTLLLLGANNVAHSAWQLNMPEGVTQISASVYELHMIIFWICVVIGCVVFGVMFWSIFHHRKSKGAKPASFHESTTVELIWTIVPVLILIGMAVPATATLRQMYDTTASDVDIQVTGYQWKWRYRYLNENIDFFSTLTTPTEQIHNQADKSEHYLLEVDNPLVLPVGKKIRFLTTSNDVIHSWWVPDFAVKKDAIPGFINEAWTRIDTPGTYRGQCAELCGKDHGFMPIVVVALADTDYQTWVTEQQQAALSKQAAAERTWTLAELMQQGEQVYNTACAACHQANGMGIPGAFPALKGSLIATQDQAAHLDIVLFGKSGTAMAAYGTQFDAVDLASVITYERNAWGNDTGDIVTPQEIKQRLQAGQ